MQLTLPFIRACSSQLLSLATSTRKQWDADRHHVHQYNKVFSGNTSAACRWILWYNIDMTRVSRAVNTQQI